MEESVKTTERGFMVYGEIEDSRGCVVRVQESSIIGEPHVWIFVDDPNGVYTHGKPSPHLTREQAIKVVTALHRFIDGDS
jgi:hypothetical protein